jgi:hypothetical protein
MYYKLTSSGQLGFSILTKFFFICSESIIGSRMDLFVFDGKLLSF